MKKELPIDVMEQTKESMKQEKTGEGSLNNNGEKRVENSLGSIEEEIVKDSLNNNEEEIVEDSLNNIKDETVEDSENEGEGFPAPVLDFDLNEEPEYEFDLNKFPEEGGEESSQREEFRLVIRKMRKILLPEFY